MSVKLQRPDQAFPCPPTDFVGKEIDLIGLPLRVSIGNLHILHHLSRRGKMNDLSFYKSCFQTLWLLKYKSLKVIKSKNSICILTVIILLG